MSESIDSILEIIPVMGSYVEVVPILAVLAGVLAAILSSFTFLIRGGLKSHKLEINFENDSKEIKDRINADVESGISPQNALMREYHAQSLSQSKVSFWFSLVFASIGFSIIALSIVIFLNTSFNSESWIENAAKPIFTLIAGTVIDAVAALFFVQSNKSRQIMTEFFDKLRIDRKLDEALKLIKDIEDPVISSRVKATIILSFSDVSTDNLSLSGILSSNLENFSKNSKES